MSPPSPVPTVRPTRAAPRLAGRAPLAGSAAAGRARVVGSAALLTVVAALGASCFTGSDGLNPPTYVSYFPTAMVVSPGRTTLYVANSDFDLQYNGGTVQALDLGGAIGLRTYARNLAQAIDAAVKAGGTQADACAAIGTIPNDESFVHPGPCTAMPIGPFVRKFATVGAFASQAVLVNRTDGLAAGARLFVTVRGDPSVTYFDIVDDRDPANPVSPCGDAFCLECGGTGEGKRCAPSHLIGSDPFDNLRNLKMPTEPTGIDAEALTAASGDPIVVANQSSNQASLVVNRWPLESNVSGPTLEYAITGLPDGPTGVVHIPPPGIIKARHGLASYRPGFIVSHRASAALTVLRYEDDGRSEPERPFLTKSDNVPITLAAQGNDSRGMAIDSTKRDACEAKCASDAEDCFQACLDIPLDLYVASRAPASLLIGHITTTADLTDGAVTGVKEVISLDEETPIPPGASGVAVGKVVDPSGQLATRIFVVSFDSRFILSYDPQLKRVDATLRTGRGPFGMAFDAVPAGTLGATTPGAEAYLYVGQFTDSYVSVFDLDMRRRTFGSVLINVGPPTPPKGEQQ